MTSSSIIITITDDTVNNEAALTRGKWWCFTKTLSVCKGDEWAEV